MAAANTSAMTAKKYLADIFLLFPFRTFPTNVIFRYLLYNIFNPIWIFSEKFFKKFLGNNLQIVFRSNFYCRVIVHPSASKQKNSRKTLRIPRNLRQNYFFIKFLHSENKSMNHKMDKLIFASAQALQRLHTLK